MPESITQRVIKNIKNIPGWRTRRKIVVIECDDWGGIRMPSGEVFDELRSSGVELSGNHFERYDTLETSEDLEMLYSALRSVSDRNGNPAIMTPITVMANPDFKRIANSGFKHYYFEPFADTLKSYYPEQGVFGIWKKGIREGIFIPELHGRDHISVPFWMNCLQEGNTDLKKSFKKGFVSLEVPGLPEPVQGFRAEFFFDSEKQKELLIQAINDSVELYKVIFGFQPKVFVPGNAIFHPDFDLTVEKAGVEFLNVYHKTPYPAGNGSMSYRTFYSGKRGPGNLRYYTRNCAFEPSAPWYKGIELTLAQVAAAFRWGKPAFISTHRVNFSGGIDPENRNRGLNELRRLLRAIVLRWPEAEFMSLRDALTFMRDQK